MRSDAAAAAEELRRHRQHCADCATARHHRNGYGCDRGQELERQAEEAAARYLETTGPIPGQLDLF